MPNIDIDYWNKKILELNSDRFEQLCYDLVDSMHPMDIEWLKGPADKGRDVRAKFLIPQPDSTQKSSEWHFECKRYSNAIEVADLNSKIAWADANKPDVLVIVSNANISNHTRGWLDTIAKDKPYDIHKWDDIEFFKRLLNQPSIIEGYFPESSMPTQTSEEIKPKNVSNITITVPPEIITELEETIKNISGLSEKEKSEKIIEILTEKLKSPKIDSRVKSLIYEQFGNYFYSQKRYDVSFKYVELALKESPNSRIVLTNEANILIKLKKYKNAITVLQEVKNIDDHDDNCLNLLGYCYNQIGKKKQAMNIWEEAISNNPENILARDNLGSMYRDETEYELANKIFQETLKLKKNSASTKNQIARLLIDLEAHEDAIVILKDVLKENPKYSDAFNNLGLAYERAHTNEANKKEYLNEAIICFKKVTEYDSNNVFGWTNLATTLTRLDKISEAKEILEKMKDDFSNEYRIWQALAFVQQAEGNTKEALKSIDRAISMNTSKENSVMSFNIKAKICLDKNMLGMAEKCISEALKIKSDSITALELKIKIKPIYKKNITEKIQEILNNFEAIRQDILSQMLDS